MSENIKELLESEMKGVSIRLPGKFHNLLKSEAALEGMTKDDYVKKLLIMGREEYKKSKK